MYKYEGRLIYQNHDDDGILEVVEYKGVRSLHFGSSSRQSSMWVADPNKLELSYVRAMTSWLLFKPTWNEALLIGLGGGSLAKHLLYHFPDCHLKAVEYRQSVVKVARSHFGLPLDPRLKIIVADGGDYVRQRTETFREHYCLLLVDAFNHDGMAESICNLAFFDACKALLKKDGMLVINLWGGTKNPVFQQVAIWLGQVFNWKILFLPVRNRGNIIGLAFNDSTPIHAMKELATHAETLEQRFDIEFKVFLKDFGKHNASTLNQVIKP
ncbi:MAG: spermine synthase [Methylococcaceae bacterium]|nr:spermine synthase [Methylococcaceae bacterium]